MKNCYKKTINNKHKMKIDQRIWQSRHSQLPPSNRVFAIVFLKQILSCFNFWKYFSSLKFYIMLVNTSLECTGIPHWENKNQCQAARDRKILIFRILLLQSLSDTQSDNLICQVIFIYDTKNWSQVLRWSVNIVIRYNEIMVHHTGLKMSRALSVISYILPFSCLMSSQGL